MNIKELIITATYIVYRQFAIIICAKIDL
jgi:hypothetical protein